MGMESVLSRQVQNPKKKMENEKETKDGECCPTLPILVWEISNENQGRPFAVTRFHCQFIGTWVTRDHALAAPD